MISEKIKIFEKKYGPRSQAVYWIKYTYLIDLLKLNCENPEMHREEINQLFIELQSIYSQSLEFLPRHPDVNYLSDHPPLMQYSQEAYSGQYGNQHAAFGEGIRELNDVLSQIETGGTYLYLIDEHQRILIYDHPLQPLELLTARQKGSNPHFPVHPMLNWPSLLACGAGELTVIRGQQRMAFVANTKSGHYRPGRSSADLLGQLLQASHDCSVYMLYPPDHREQL